MTLPSVPDTSSDPRPEPPPAPALEACCGMGCDPCVFDLYAEAMERYRTALEEWARRSRS